MKVAVIMGSTSDWDIMKAAVETLEELGIEYEKRATFFMSTSSFIRSTTCKVFFFTGGTIRQIVLFVKHISHNFSNDLHS